MTYDLIGAGLAVRASRAATGSARPHAPVLPERGRTQRLRGARSRSAAVLHALARRVEPRPAPSNACRTA